jgi:hypothetical protein
VAAKKKVTKKKSKKNIAKRGKGRPRIITNENEKEILAILTIGGSRNTAADYVSIARTTLRDHIARDEVFSEQVKRAEAAGQLKHLKKVGGADQWQASAWMLERKWPDEFGRKDRQDVPADDMTSVLTKLIDKLPN